MNLDFHHHSKIFQIIISKHLHHTSIIHQNPSRCHARMALYTRRRVRRVHWSPQMTSPEVDDAINAWIWGLRTEVLQPKGTFYSHGRAMFGGTMMKWLHAEQGSMFGMLANDSDLVIFIVMPYLIIPVLPGVLGATLWHQSSRLIPFDMSGIIFHPAMPELVKGTVYRTSYLMDSMQLPVGCSLVFPSIWNQFYLAYGFGVIQTICW